MSNDKNQTNYCKRCGRKLGWPINNAAQAAGVLRVGTVRCNLCGKKRACYGTIDLPVFANDPRKVPLQETGRTPDQSASNSNSKSATSNGNGKGNGKSAKCSQRKQRLRSFKKEDMPELAVLLAFMVQRAGSISDAEIARQLKEVYFCKVVAVTLSNALEALRQKRIIAENFREDEDGYNVPFYSMKRLKFIGKSMEIAQMSSEALLMQLYTMDPNARLIKAEIEGYVDEHGEKKQDPSKWARYTFRIKLLEPWCGGIAPSGNALLAEYRAAGFKRGLRPYRRNGQTWSACKEPSKDLLVFDRFVNGDLMIQQKCVSGFLTANLNRATRRGGRTLSGFSIHYFNVESVRVVPERGQLTIVPRTVQGRDNKDPAAVSVGVGYSNLETLCPGTEVEINFSAPTRNFLTPPEMAVWFGRIVRSAHRYIAPGRGTMYGAAELLDCKYEYWATRDLKEICQWETKFEAIEREHTLLLAKAQADAVEDAATEPVTQPN